MSLSFPAGYVRVSSFPLTTRFRVAVPFSRASIVQVSVSDVSAFSSFTFCPGSISGMRGKSFCDSGTGIPWVFLGVSEWLLMWFGSLVFELCVAG